MTEHQDRVDLTAAADLCDKAADVIDTDGWFRGEMWLGAAAGERWEPGKPVCAVGALRVAAGHLDRDDMIARSRNEAYHAARSALEQLLGGPFAIVPWNDNQAQTAGQVSGKWREAGKALRERAGQEPPS